jgi:iron complex outermembrane recepter protein
MPHNHPLSRAVALLLILVPHARAQGSDGAQPSQDLTELSLEDLMNVEVEVTSASRHAQPLAKTPAAIFVLTADDIRRSGASSVPEALRSVPGVDVARLDANRWAVSIRGMNNQFANKLLVLVDGRSVYTPLFSGVWWDTMDPPLEDIERIEVIRGPGAALWGANAVNGIINVITKSAAETQGAYAQGTIGTEDRFLGYARYGGATKDGHWRVWAKYLDRDASRESSGNDGSDDWSMFRTGFRVDRALSERDTWTISGDAHTGVINNRYDVAAPAPQYFTSGPASEDVWGAVVQSRWVRKLSETSDFALQASLEHTDRDLVHFAEKRTTANFDFQHRLQLGEVQDFTWGLAARTTYAETTDTFVLSWRDNHRTDSVFSAFAQDEIALAKDLWTLTLGARLEHNDFTGLELQPNARILFTPNERDTWWASVSRAVRTPSQADQDVTFPQAVIPGAPDQIITSQGNPELDSEVLEAAEIGYRTRFGERVSVDTTAFLNHYSNLIVAEQGAPFFSGGSIIVPFVNQNVASADSYGFELTADWTPVDDTRISLTFSTQRIQVDTHDSASPAAAEAGDSLPENQGHLRLQHDFGASVDGDVMLSYVDHLTGTLVDHYWRLDSRLEYRPDAHRSFAVGVQNLLHQHEVEYGPGTFSPSNQMEVALYLQASWSF